MHYLIYDIILALSLLFLDGPITIFTDAVCKIGSPITNRPFTKSIANRTILGPILSSITTTDERACEMECHLSIPDACFMFNYCPKTKLCELLYKNQVEKYSVQEKEGCSFKTRKCHRNPCFNGGECYALGNVNNRSCECGPLNNGTLCHDFIDRGIKANTAPICIGSKGNAFGRVFAPIKGRVKTIRLIHLSGEVGTTPAKPSYWGDVSVNPYEIQLIVTDENNDRLIPPEDYPFRHDKTLSYNTFGFTFNSPELVFPVLSAPFNVNKGTEIRIWFGEDLTDFNESNNRGETCADAYVLYEDE